MTGNYLFSKTSFQSPSFIKNENQRLPVSTTIFHTPGNALQLEYVNAKKGNWQATIFSENMRGQDHFKPVQYFSFSVYVSSGTASKHLPAYQLIMKDSSLSAKCTYEINKLNAWETIYYRFLFVGRINFTNPDDVAGIVFSQNSDDGDKHTIYVDDIEFLSTKADAPITAKPVLMESKGYAKHVDISWQPFSDEQVKYVKIYRSENGKAIPVGIQSPMINRYTLILQE